MNARDVYAATTWAVRTVVPRVLIAFDHLARAVPLSKLPAVTSEATALRADVALRAVPPTRGAEGVLETATGIAVLAYAMTRAADVLPDAPVWVAAEVERLILRAARMLPGDVGANERALRAELARRLVEAREGGRVECQLVLGGARS